MQQAIDPTHYQWKIDSIQSDLTFIRLDVLITEVNVLSEYTSTDAQLEADYKALAKKARAAKSDIKKQIKAMRKVQLCEELLSIVPKDSDTAKDLEKKIARICA